MKYGKWTMTQKTIISLVQFSDIALLSNSSKTENIRNVKNVQPEFVVISVNAAISQLLEMFTSLTT